MNEYLKLKKKLFSLISQKSKLKLINISKANAYLNFPNRNFESIHVAGTNGKGSVVTKLACALTYSGYKTGLYISPHITSYRERIKIDGKCISKQDTTEILNELFHIQKKLQIYLSFFEITTLLAFVYFSKKKIDFAVIETGLGGRLDATNIITPILSVITSISYDHMDILGDTLDEIAREKAHIIKSKIPVVLGPSAQLKVIINHARLNKSEIFYASNIKGFYDIQNQEVAKTCLNILSRKYAINKETISKALNTRPKGRFEVVKNLGPKAIIYDVAHNQAAFWELKKALNLFYPNEKIRVILGFSKYKDIEACVKVIITFSTFIHLISINNIKALAKEKIHKVLIKQNFLKCKLENDNEKAFILAKNLAEKNNEILLMCGSFFVVSEGKNYLKNLSFD